MSLFDVIKNMSYGKEPVSLDGVDYSSYVVNKAFSMFVDTVLHANEMNIRPDINKYQNYGYYFNAVRKKKRFSKWPKNKASDEEVLVSKIYKYNQQKTKQVLKLLTEDQIETLKNVYDEGGA